jgi:hypothetical protein
MTLGTPTTAGGHPFWHLLVVALASVAVFAGIKAWESWCAHVEKRGPEPPPWTGRRSPLVVELAVASLGSSATHFMAGPSHFREATAFGLFFLGAAAFQAAWALAVIRRTTRLLLIVGAAVNAGFLALWFVTRTVGLPMGPRVWQPEAIGPPDALSSVLEVAVVVGSLWLMRRHYPRSAAVRNLPRCTRTMTQPPSTTSSTQEGRTTTSISRS